MARIILALVLELSLGLPSTNTGAPPVPIGAKVAATGQRDQAQNLLDESYALSSGLDAIDRIRFLNDLVIMAPEIAAPDKVDAWARELAHLARTVKIDKLSGPDRIAFQKNAVVALSKVNVTAAMQLFSEIGPLVPNAENRFPEDIRAFGARTLFPRYFKVLGRESLPTIRQQAARLPDTNGAYPFHAISLIFADIAGSSSNNGTLVDELFAEAVKYYRCGSKIENQDSEFFTFLQNTNSIVNKSLLIRAVHDFVTHLTDPRCDSRPQVDQYWAVIETSKGDVQLTDERKTLLFRAFSLISEIDPAFGEQLRQNNPELALANAAITNVASSRFPLNSTPEQQAQVEKVTLQRSLLRGVRNVCTSNPQAALQMAELIEDPSSRTVAVSLVLPALAQSDLQQTKQLYNRELDNLDSLKEGSQRSEATLWMAEAAYYAQDFDNFDYLTSKTFEDGIQRFGDSFTTRPDSADLAVDNRPGYDELGELVAFASAHGISWPLNAVQQMTDLRLRVHLLLFAARGLKQFSAA